MKSWRVAFGISALSLATIGVACGPGFLDGISGGSVSVDSGPPDAADARACQPNTLPARPEQGDNALTVGLPIFAIDALRIDTFGSADAGGEIPIGIDLDNRCTCPEDDSCVRKGGGAGENFCDGRRGEDNALSVLFNQVRQQAPVFDQTFATDRIRRGFGTLIVEILGWNGQPNDTQVTVTLRLSEQLDAPKVDGGFGLPKFDGTDVWTLETIAVSGEDKAVGVDCADPKQAIFCTALTRDDSAYVRDGKLVARPRYRGKPDDPVPLVISSDIGPIYFDIFELTLFATLAPAADGGISRLNGEIVGRVSASNMVRSIATLNDFIEPDSGQALCQNLILFNLAKNQVCSVPDLAAPGKDNQGARCDHVSLAMSFAAGPARIGHVTKTPPLTPICDESSFFCP